MVLLWGRWETEKGRWVIAEEATANSQKTKVNGYLMREWELEIGTYPGVMLGARSYDFDSGHVDYCLYIPFIVLIITTYKEWRKNTYLY